MSDPTETSAQQQNICPDCGADLAKEHHKNGWCPSVGVLPPQETRGCQLESFRGAELCFDGCGQAGECLRSNRVPAAEFDAEKLSDSELQECMEEQRKRDAMAARVYAPAAGVNIDLTQGEKDTLARIDNAKAAGVRLNQFWLDWEAARRSPAATADVSELADAAEAVLLPEIASLEAGIHRKNEEIAELRRLVEGLKSALKPFVSVSDQPTSQMAKVIHKGVSGLAPVALTVTKDQFKAAMSALSSTKDTQP